MAYQWGPGTIAGVPEGAQPPLGQYPAGPAVSTDPLEGDPLDGGDGTQTIVASVGNGELSPEAAQQLLDLYFKLLGSINKDVALGFDPMVEAQRFIDMAKKGNLVQALNGLQGLITTAQGLARDAGDRAERVRQAQADEANRLLTERQTAVSEGQLGISRETLGIQQGQLGVQQGQLGVQQAGQRLAEQQFQQDKTNEQQRIREAATAALLNLGGQESGALQGMMGWLTQNVPNLPPPTPGAMSEGSRLIADLTTRVGAPAAAPLAYGGPLTIPPFLLPFQGLKDRILAAGG